jgi:hypothetical protein
MPQANVTSLGGGDTGNRFRCLPSIAGCHPQCRIRVNLLTCEARKRPFCIFTYWIILLCQAMRR